jgi:tyrosine-protein phosphatase YwqE
MKDIKAIDDKKYILIEANLDEIGRMLGGWIKSTKTVS